MKSTFTLIFCLITAFGYSQTKEIQIEFIGNCGLYMTDGNTNIYTDFPYKSAAHGYMEFDHSELDSIEPNSIFIFTHKHSDHYSKKNLKKVLQNKSGQTFGPWNISKLQTLSDSINDFRIEAFKTKHKFSLRHYSYLITWHNKRIFLSGDTEDASKLAVIKNIDWAFTPYWILLDAKEREIEIDAKMFGLYHLATIQIPSAKENYDNVENIKRIVKQGEKFQIE